MRTLEKSECVTAFKLIPLLLHNQPTVLATYAPIDRYNLGSICMYVQKYVHICVLSVVSKHNTGINMQMYINSNNEVRLLHVKKYS